MNDFLKKMRNGNDRNFDRGRRQYVNPQFLNTGKQNGKDNRKPPFRKNNDMDKMAALISETLPIIRSNIEDIADTQRQLAELAERRTKAEERKAGAIEKIAASLESYLGTGKAQVVKEEEMEAVSPAAEEPEPVEEKTTVRPTNKGMNRQKVVRMIRTMRDQGSTYSQIARHLEEKNITTFSGKGKWHPQTVQKIYQS